MERKGKVGSQVWQVVSKGLKRRMTFEPKLKMRR